MSSQPLARSTGAARSPGTDRPSTARRPQRWEQVAAWAAFACTVPSAVWRLLMLVGALPGTAELRALHADEPGYVVGLSIVQVLCGWLVVGLVRPWGERLAGIDIPRWLPVILGTLGGLLVTWLFTVTLAGQLPGGARPDQYTVHGSALALMVAAYLPILLWGPLTLAAVVGYSRRHLAGRS